MLIVYVGFDVSGTMVLRAFGVPDGGAESDCCAVGAFVVPDAGCVFEAVKMWRSDGPSGSMCREISIGMDGFRYFIRGSISRQNFLSPA